ncbi:hypothetical protein SCORR_v1c01130 [Spiroplasma corruscae]|uniref:Transmembrane protein n=1 Tax=Spiroplasma corruscae TaxID=216934 RepID=A0A222EN36_9MOLU|nr:hypothetical protein [Spiroplasma corruscae]ASP27888.1 hypothetical protein SCORR_v1c01130 [Spiroplasma corruscae]
MKADGLCKAGCIVAIISSCLFIFGCLMFIVIFMVSALVSSKGYEPVVLSILAIYAIPLLVVIIVQIPTLVLCSKVLKGTAKSKNAAGVVSIIFTGVLGGVLILCGNYQNNGNEE